LEGTGAAEGDEGAIPPLLRLDEDLVPELSGLGQVVEHFGSLRAGRIDLHAAVAEDATDERLLGRAVLDPVDRDDLLLAAEDAGLELDPLVGQDVGDRLPAYPHDDEPEQCDRDHQRAQDLAQVRRVEAVVGAEDREVGDRDDDQEDHRHHGALDHCDPVRVILQDEVLAGKELAHGRVLSPT